MKNNEWQWVYILKDAVKGLNRAGDFEIRWTENIVVKISWFSSFTRNVYNTCYIR